MLHKSREELYQLVFMAPPPIKPLSPDITPNEITDDLSQHNVRDTAPDDVTTDTALGGALMPEEREPAPSHQHINSEKLPETAIAASAIVQPTYPLQDNTTAMQHGQQSGNVPCLDGAQPLNPLSFPNQPHPGTQQLPATISNVRHLLTSYGIFVTYDVIRKKLMITLPRRSGTTDNADNVGMAHVISLASLNRMPIGQVPAYVLAVADEQQYNPAAAWIMSRPWDGKDRLPDIYATVTEREGYPRILKRILIYKWLLSAIAAALLPSGFKARGVLTFQGPQSIGKTSWLMSLVPDLNLREMLVKIDHLLDAGNKDSILGAICHWLVEIGELDSSFKKGISRLKGFLTSDFDKIRRPYALAASEYPRRTVFFASVNQIDFLVDESGNSRWWTIPVDAINYNHGIEMQQLWAQLAADFYAGKEWWLTKNEEELLESCNQEHRGISVIRERLMETIDLSMIGKDGNPAMTPTNVLIKLGFTNPSNSKAKECAAILRELLGEPKKINGSYKWRIPLKQFTPTSCGNKY